MWNKNIPSLASSVLQAKFNLVCSQTADEYNTASKRQYTHCDMKSVGLMADGAAFVSRSGSQTRLANS